MEKHVPDFVALAKALLERAEKGSKRELASSMVDAARDIVGFRLQLSKLQEYGKEISELVSRDAKAAMFFQLSKFRADYDKHQATVVNMNLDLKLLDWDTLHASNVRCLQNEVVADYISHKATVLGQAADRLMEDAKETCGAYHVPETSWKATLGETDDLKVILQQSHDTLGKIKSADMNTYMKALKEASFVG